MIKYKHYDSLSNMEIQPSNFRKLLKNINQL